MPDFGKAGNLTRGEPEISFDIYLNGTRVVFVNGRVNQEGWINNVYYNRVELNSYNLLNLDNLLSLQRELHKIVIAFEKKQTVNPFDFTIGFYNDTNTFWIA